MTSVNAILYEREMERGARNLEEFEAAWGRYVVALRAVSESQSHPDGRARYGKRRALRAARRRLERVCREQGIECPV